MLLSEELTLRENSRIKTALGMGRLGTIKTLAGFDFSFQPSLDRDRILTLPSSASSSAARPFTSSGLRARARAISPPHSAWRRSRPAGASTSPPWPS